MDDDDLEIDPEMAAAMGFTSFGAKPSKRRKFNHNEAVIEGQDGEPEVIASSGANNTALGMRSRPVAAAMAQESVEGVSVVDEKDGVETTGSKKNKQKAPRGLADYIAWGNTVTAPPPPPPPPSLPQVQTQVAVPQTLSLPAQTTSIVPATGEGKLGGQGAESWPQGMPSGQELASLRRGVQNARGDMAYFLPSFIEDPWKALVG